MKFSKYAALTLTIGLGALISAGCNDKPAVDPNAKAGPATVTKPQLPSTATPAQQAAAQAQMDAARAQGEAYARQMEEKFKKK